SVALGRRLSMLELEAQAEVDKFASLVLQHWPSLEEASARALHARLFRDVSYRPGLGPEEQARYVEANRLAALFTARLPAHPVPRRPPGPRGRQKGGPSARGAQVRLQARSGGQAAPPRSRGVRVLVQSVSLP